MHTGRPRTQVGLPEGSAKQLVAELTKGANTPLGGPLVTAALRTDLTPGQIDICAMLLGPQRRVRGDGDFVFFNQERSACGSTHRLSPVELQIDLRRVPGNVETVLVAASLDDDVPGSLAGHCDGFIARDGADPIRHLFDGLTSERCVIAAEVYRRDGGWKLRAVSQGYDDLTDLVHHFGLETEDPAPSAVRPAPLPAETEDPAPSAVRPARLPPLPAETDEIVDRIRRGAAVRRAASAPRRPRPQARPQARRSMPASQYKALRHHEAEQLTAELEHQIQQVEAVLRQLPRPDLGSPALDALLDGSVPRSINLNWLRRRPSPARPSQALRPALHDLRHLATNPFHEAAIEAWLWLSWHAAAGQPSLGQVERIVVQAQRQRVVVEAAAPERSVVPLHRRVRYRPGVDRLDHQPLPERERTRLVETLFGAAALAQAHVIATGLGAVGLPVDWAIAVNVWEWSRDPATGQQERICRCNLAVTPQDLGRLHLIDVDPLACVRSLGGDVSADGRLTPRATAQRPRQGREVDLRTIDPYAFEHLIRDLAEAMGYVATVTPRSGDHGVDVVVESSDTLANGRIVISAKRYRDTVGPDHVRALDAVIREQGAIKEGILITTSRFGPESERFARGKPIELVDGERLRQWLATYLGVTA